MNYAEWLEKAKDEINNGNQKVHPFELDQFD